MIREFLHRSWPWYVTCPLMRPVAVGPLLTGNKQFGVSTSLRHLCAAWGLYLPSGSAGRSSALAPGRSSL